MLCDGHWPVDTIQIGLVVSKYIFEKLLLTHPYSR